MKSENWDSGQGKEMILEYRENVMFECRGNIDNKELKEKYQ